MRTTLNSPRTLAPRRLLVLTAALLTAALLLLGAAAGAHAAPSLQVSSGSNTTARPGEQLTYRIQIENLGDSATEGELHLTIDLPAGMLGVSADTSGIPGGPVPFECPAIAGSQHITCEGAPLFPARIGDGIFLLTVALAPDATGVLTTTFDLEGGGALLAAHTVDPVTVTSAPPPFGVDAFDSVATTAGAPLTTAGAHPDALSTSIDFSTFTDPNPVVGDVTPVEDTKDVIVDLPPGLFGNPAGVSQCRLGQLALGGLAPKPLCPVGSQVGTAQVRSGGATLAIVALFNMVPPPGAPSRFGFNVSGAIVSLDVHPRTEGDFGLEVTAAGVPQGLAISGNIIRIWGLPSDPVHDPERPCSGELAPTEGGHTCPSDSPLQAFFRTPTYCGGPAALSTRLHIDSWQHPGAFVSRTISTHQGPGYPYDPSDWGPPLGIEGCQQVPFEPTLDAALTTNRADAPTGLSVDIALPDDCWDPKATVAEAEAGICQSDMREAEVTLPQGLTLNPAAASGREACSPAQIGLSTPVGASPVRFDQSPAGCPEASRIGSVEISTPLLGLHDKDGEPVTDSEGKSVLDPLEGSVYLAQQSQNPFGSLLAIYLVAEGNGVIVKQAGEIELGNDGHIVTRFAETPQTPFSKIHVELFGGPRATLRTPAACGTYTANATFTPWSGTGAVQRQSSFQVSEGCGGGFDPALVAGTQNPLAGAFSPFNLRLTREDGSQELAGLSATLPPGLIGAPKGVSYCPEAVLAAFPAPTVLGTGAAEIAAPRCPAASRVGSVTVGAGAGPSPFYTATGKAYLAGPYKGAPLSLAVVAPAVAGPFDLGTVLVRNALRVNPETIQVTAVSDPLPSILHGIPLDLRDVRVSLDRPNFTLNPTSCEPMSIDVTLTSTAGATAQRSKHFQAASCDRLEFKPKLTLKLKGGTKRSKNPALTAILQARKGDANIGRVQVALPHSEFLAQSHIRTICTRVQFAAGGGGGEQCPKGSIYGKVSATSPLVDYPLTGNVYLRSSANPLPDLVLALHGPPTQPLQATAVGRIDSKDGGIRTTFATVPDAPLSKVVIRFPGGRKSLLENSTNLCKATKKATVAMEAHNAKRSDSTPVLEVKCPKGGKAKKHRSGR